MKTRPTEIYSDEAILVIDKPAGWLSIPDRYDQQRPNIRHYYAQRLGEIFMVHRLDADTSGVMVLAKTAAAHANLNDQFASRETKKIYHAIVDGRLAEPTGTIDRPIAGDKSRPGRMVITSSRGKEAITDYRVIEELGNFSLLEVEIHTGRTHQIRVHLQSIGHPLMVDALYGRRSEFFLSEVKGSKYSLGRDKVERPLLRRAPLHAMELRFTHPDSGEPQHFTSDPPKDFRAVLYQLRKLS